MEPIPYVHFCHSRVRKMLDLLPIELAKISREPPRAIRLGNRQARRRIRRVVHERTDPEVYHLERFSFQRFLQHLRSAIIERPDRLLIHQRDMNQIVSSVRILDTVELAIVSWRENRGPIQVQSLL